MQSPADIQCKIRSNSQKCHKALNNQRCLKQTKAKTKEYEVKLGRLCCGPRGYLFSIATLTHSTGQNHGFAYLGGSSLTAPPVSYKNQKYQLIIKNSDEETEK